MPRALVPRDHVDRRNAAVAAYTDVLSEVARSGNHVYVDLFQPLRQIGASVTSDGLHPTVDGYARLAQMIGDSLGLPPPRIDCQTVQAAKIRAAIVRKNTLYFHRWRPRNDAFVYGERKSEQVIAQREPQSFEPLIAQQEQHIQNLLGEIGGAP